MAGIGVQYRTCFNAVVLYRVQKHNISTAMKIYFEYYYSAAFLTLIFRA